MKIVIAGASGFVGSHLIEALKKNSEFNLIALSRSKTENLDGIEWRKVDLFSLKDAELGVDGADVAFYLVHSMMPTDRLSQGDFHDFDLIAADNFARACHAKGVKQIIYVSGIVPNDKKLSKHLESRYEVEKVLGAYSPSLTTIRCGLVIGAEGSTFQIMLRLVERLPVMLCPSWTRSKTEAVYVDDLVFALLFCINNKDTHSKSFDLGSGDVVSYQEMMEVASKVLNKKKLFIPIALLSPKLSSYWLSLISSAPLSLTKPIVDSLRHDIVCGNNSLQKMAKLNMTSLSSAIKLSHQAFLKIKKGKKPKAYVKSKTRVNVVRSVQRLGESLPVSAEYVADEYMKFLNTLLFGFMNVQISDKVCSFNLAIVNKTLLEITHSPERSEENRQLFYVTGGLLAKSTKRARLEFRVVPGANALISALHDYKPSLPWWIYVWTQANLHSFVMNKFSKNLAKKIPINN